MMKKLLITFALYGMAVSTAQAVNIRVLNQNFESDAINPAIGFNDYMTGWVSSGFGTFGVYAPEANTEYSELDNRGQIAYLNQGARISQTIGTKLQEGETYTLSFDLGFPQSASGQNIIARFKANGLVIGQTHITDSDTLGTPGTWSEQKLRFVSKSNMPIGSPLVVEFQNAALSENHQTHIDNIKVTKAGTGKSLPPIYVGDNGLSLIATDTTLRVPEEYSSIHAALAYLQNKHIKADKTVTIKVSDCTQHRPTNPVEMHHHQGANIHIIGNQEDPNACNLIFLENSHGFIANNGRVFGLIDGFRISGQSSALGIFASEGSNVNLGPNIDVRGFSSNIAAYRNARIFADNISTEYGNNYNFIASQRGIISANHSRASNARGTYADDYRAHTSSAIFANHSAAQSIYGYSYRSSDLSYIQAEKSYSFDSSQEAYLGGSNSMIYAPLSGANSFTRNAYSASALTLIDRRNASTTNASPAVNGTGNSNSTMR